MTDEERRVSEAIKGLREHFGESQQRFSDRLGVTVRTVARYELEKPPPDEMLGKLANMADEAAREDLWFVFMMARVRLQNPELANVWVPSEPEIVIKWLDKHSHGSGFRSRLSSFLRKELRDAVKKRGRPLAKLEREYLGDLAKELDVRGKQD